MAGHTQTFSPQEIGTAVQAAEVGSTLSGMLSSASVGQDLVRLVLVKCPLLTSAKIAAAKSNGQAVVTTDTYESMARSRYVSAVGVALALGELIPGDVEGKVLAQDASEQHWSPRASCSSGAELDDCHILALAALAEPGGRAQGTFRVHGRRHRR